MIERTEFCLFAVKKKREDAMMMQVQFGPGWERWRVHVCPSGTIIPGVLRSDAHAERSINNAS
jgi:hypothetical protein